MRGRFQDQGGIFSYIQPEKRIPANQRALPEKTDGDVLPIPCAAKRDRRLGN
jgi:hypothetical protein